MRPARVERPRMLCVADAAVLLDVSESALRAALARGELPGVRVGRLWRVPSDVVERLLVARPPRPEAGP